MTVIICKLLLLIILAEAVTELICKAEILERPRSYVKSLGWFFDELLSCYYCTSVWVGIILAQLYFVSDNVYILVFCSGIVVHRLSNYVHLLFSILRDIQINMRLERNKGR